LEVGNHRYERGSEAAALHAHAPQGRVGGIKNLQTEEAEGMLAAGFGLSSCFKTASVFGFQPVIIPDIVKEMF
jgi:propanediol dehydratase large subunit